MRTHVAVAATLLTLAGCDGEEPESAASPPSGGGIVFTVSREGFGEIWLMNADGNDRRRLTAAAPKQSDASGNREPAWSPDGGRIAFIGTGEQTRESESDKELYVMAADGSGIRRLTMNDAPDSSPAWSPDGERIAVARAPGWGTEQARAAIYVVDADGGGERLLFSDEEGDAPSWVAGLSWSPDGAGIAFGFVSASAWPPTSRLYVIPTGGGEPHPLLDDAAQPAWSPDGRSIAFTSARDRFGETCFHDCAPSVEIYVANADGTGLRRLTRTQATDFSPRWSPDGTRIVFVSDRSNREEHEYELWTVDADGGVPRRLTRNDVWDLDPDWR